MKISLALIAAVFALSLAACGGSSGSSSTIPTNSQPAGPDVSIGLNSTGITTPPAKPISVDNQVAAGSAISFTVSEKNYTGAFTLTPAAGNAACIVLTGSNPYSVSATTCTATSSATFVVTDSAGGAVNMVVNYIVPTH